MQICPPGCPTGWFYRHHMASATRVLAYENIGDQRFTTDKDAVIQPWIAGPDDELTVDFRWYALEIGDPYKIIGQIRVFCDPV